MTIYYDNPAGRLHRVLYGLKQVNPTSIGVRDAWGSVLKVQNLDQNMSKLSRRIVKVFQLPIQVDLEMQQVSDQLFDRDFSMRWWKAVEKTFSATLFSTGQIVQTLHYTDESLAALEHCSYLLHAHHREAAPDGNALESIRQKIGEIEEMVATDGEIDVNLAEFLVKQARAMLIALDDFDVTGVSPIHDAIDEAIGGAIRRGYLPEKDDPEAANDRTGSKVATKKFWSYIAHAALVTSMAANMASIGQFSHDEFAGKSQTPPAIEMILIYS